MATTAGKSSASCLGHRPAVKQRGAAPLPSLGEGGLLWVQSQPCTCWYSLPWPQHSYLLSERHRIKALAVLISQDCRSRVDGTGHSCPSCSCWPGQRSEGSSTEEVCGGSQGAGVAWGQVGDPECSLRHPCVRLWGSSRLAGISFSFFSPYYLYKFNVELLHLKIPHMHSVGFIRFENLSL